MMNPNERELLLHFLDGEELTELESHTLVQKLSDKTDREELHGWFAFGAALREHLAVPPKREIELSRERLLARALLREKGKTVRLESRRRVFLRWTIPAAAAILLALGLWLWSPWAPPTLVRHISGTVTVIQNRVTTSKGQTGAVELTDRSRVYLLEQTDLSIQTGDKGLTVDLTRGSAAFDVPKKIESETFTVTTPLAQIEVTGTQFDSVLDGEKLTVTVYQGSVTVRNAHGSKKVEAYEKAVVRAASAPEVKLAGQIALSSNQDGNSEIFIIDPDGSNLKRLTDNPAADVSPAWSPDGKRICFISDRDGNAEIYCIKSDGSDLNRLTFTEAMESAPSWSPDGRQIAYASNRDGNWDIYTMSSDGSNTRKLTNHKGTDTAPSWAPEDHRIAFVSNRDGNADILTMNTDGSDKRKLTHTDNFEGTMDWSPDGRRIAFEAERDGIHSIYIADENGTQLKALVHQNKNAMSPDWSPDGTKIIFTLGQADDAEIYMVNSDGSNLTRLTHNKNADTTPDWSPVKFWPLTQ